MNLFSLLFAVIGVLVFSSAYLYAQQKSAKDKKFVIYYGAELDSEAFLPYDIIVFDGRAHPQLRPLKNRKKTILSYLSIGEIEKTDPNYSKIEAMGLILDENPKWPGSMIVDIRDPRWAKYLIEEYIPTLLFKRFDGFMLDTLDSPLGIWTKSPALFKGMDVAAVALVEAIHQNFPEAKLMLNRGFEVLPKVAPHLQYILAESTMVAFDEKANESKKLTDEQRSGVLKVIGDALSINPKLLIHTVDYVPAEQNDLVLEVYKKQRQLGFIPYVSMPNLTDIQVEPKS